MELFKNQKVLKQERVPVAHLLEAPAKLECLTTGVGLQNFIQNKYLYRPQLALAGYVGLFNYNQVQIFGNTEHYYLDSLPRTDRVKAFSTLCQFPIPCIVLTNNNRLNPDLIAIAKKNSIAVFTTPYDTTTTSFRLSEYLDDVFAPQIVVHGSFMDVYGVGMLFAGKSGIGKSEIALDLVERGHRLVTDDVVMLTKKREAILMGTGTSMVQHFMEIRGLGIIDIRQMFGIRSIRFQKRLETIVVLEEWDRAEEYTRTGLDEEPTEVMGVEISTVKLPIFPGKNITVIAEVIALNYLLRTYGYNAAQVFSQKLQDSIKMRGGPGKPFKDSRIITYFQSDSE
ncbi:MAG: HPr(Ser) kinase/phosphatase [Candidatus Kapaibacterium sp.]